jgi:hypothetical protein
MDKQLVAHILDCPNEPQHAFCNEVRPLVEFVQRLAYEPVETLNVIQVAAKARELVRW